ncbi:MAG: hypothetical protein HY400_01280 [Elusimicrobia bacterium]|nr:hypothetical protein [Elusimicrobiota bacterium]
MKHKIWTFILLLAPSFAFCVPPHGKTSVRVRVDISESGGIFKLNEDIQIPPETKVEGSVAVLLGSLRMEGEVTDDILAFGKSAYLNGPVGGDVLILAPSLKLGPLAKIKGDLVILGSEVEKDPEAQILGDTVSIKGFALGSLLSGLLACLAGLGGLAAALFFWLKFLSSIGWLVLAMILALLLPQPLTKSSNFLQAQPLKSFVAGILVWPILLMASLGLVFSLVGILLIPFVILAKALLLLWGTLTAGHWLGQKILKAIRQKASIWGTCLLGNASLLFLSWIPVLGKIFCLAALIVGVGAALLAMLSSDSKRKAI